MYTIGGFPYKICTLSILFCLHCSTPPTCCKRCACWCSAFSNRRLPCIPLGTFYPCSSAAMTGSVITPFYLLSIITESDLSVLSDTAIAIDLKSLWKCVVSAAEWGKMIHKWECNGEVGWWGSRFSRVWWNSFFSWYLWPHSLLI